MLRALASALFGVTALGLSLVPAMANSELPSVAVIQNEDRTFRPGADLDTIIERGWIDFAVYEDFAPYSSEVEGELVGVDIDLARLIADDLGVEARFRQVGAGETVDDDLRYQVWKGPLIGDEVANVMMHVPYNRELDIRNELVVLTGQYMRESTAIAYSKAAYPEEKPVPAYFRFDLVGVENDSLADFYLSSIAGGQIVPNMRRFATPALAMKALRDGEVKAVLGSRAQLEAGVNDDVAVHQPPLPGLAIGDWTIGVAVRHNYRALGYAVDDAIAAAIADGRLEEIFEKHGLTFQQPER